MCLYACMCVHACAYVCMCVPACIYMCTVLAGADDERNHCLASEVSCTVYRHIIIYYHTFVHTTSLLKRLRSN